MIVLDEQLSDPELRDAITAWAGSRVCNITDLRPNSLIGDDAIPRLLRTQRRPTFVTINWTDFWLVAPADRRYCIACFAFPQHSRHEVPSALRRLLSFREFRDAGARMGKVALVRSSQVHYYQFPSEEVHAFPWVAR